VRLTLRTLLAYLDDTLEASEIKEIGQKVAESDAAQELVARLKQVTRRRRLTVPAASGPEGTDPNDVAEYLDNELAADRVSELEKLALESDVHLAEIAACHQILTLVLGEPALVPPKAKERMYGLVQGREAIPYRKASSPKKTDKEAVVDEDSLALSSGWLRWVLPAASLLLVGLLGLAVYQVLPGPKQKDKQVAGRDRGGEGGPRDGDARGNGERDKEKKGRENAGLAANGTGNKKGKEEPAGAGPGPVKKGKEGGAEDKGPPGKDPAVVERAPAPSKTRLAVANYAGGLSDLPTALLVRPDGKDDWQKLSAGNTVWTNDTLVALPGFVNVVRSRSGVRLLLRGNVRDFTIAPIMDYLMDSAVILHAPGDNFDLDLTLLRGRIFLRNGKDKGKATVRLRFETEVWDLTLAEPGDEVAADLTKSYSPVINYRKGEEPRAQCYLAVLRGEVGIKADAFDSYTVEVEPPRWARLEWDSFTGRPRSGPVKEDKLPASWSIQPPSPDLLPEGRRADLKRMQAALKDLEVLLGSRKVVDALRETLEKSDPKARALAIYCLTAVDAIGPVIDALGDEDPAHYTDREAAFYSLQRWVSRSPAEGKQLYDEKTGTGILTEKKYKQREAEAIFQLLHPLLAENLGKKETYDFLARCLQHKKVAIAELGLWHLLWLSGGAKLPAGFNAAMPLEDREKYAAGIQAMIDKGQLPPMAERPAPKGTGGSGG
jgi:hypothetical protein